MSIRSMAIQALLALFLGACSSKQTITLDDARKAAASESAVEIKKRIVERGHLRCGVNTHLPGFSSKNPQGNWSGLDVDICRALAIVLFNNDKKVVYVPLNASERFQALADGSIDILSRNTTVTLQRERGMGLSFGPIVFYDGQGFIVHAKDGITNLHQLSGMKICTQKGTSNEANLLGWHEQQKMLLFMQTFEKYEELQTAFFSGQCDAMSMDASALASLIQSSKNPKDYKLLPEVISKEPLAPVVKAGDREWEALVRWTVHALVAAEELGISSSNIQEFMASKNPEVRALLGLDAGNGRVLGVDEQWAAQVIRRIGNYAEIWDRNVGEDSPLQLKRGRNALWSHGGLLYSPPMR